VALVARLAGAGRFRCHPLGDLALQSAARPRIRALEAARTGRGRGAHLGAYRLGPFAILGHTRMEHLGRCTALRRRAWPPAPRCPHRRGTAQMAHVGDGRGPVPGCVRRVLAPPVFQPGPLACLPGRRKADGHGVLHRRHPFHKAAAVRPLVRGRDDELLLHGLVLPRSACARTQNRAGGRLQPRHPDVRRDGRDGRVFDRVQPRRYGGQAA